jgi:hypothetical protein
MKTKLNILNNRSTSALTPTNTNMDIVPAAVLISMCFEARTHAHRLHLQTNSYAQHMALDSFYNGIIPLVDAYAESYQGRYGILREYPEVQLTSTTPELLIEELRTFIDNIRSNCGSQSELQNDIDSIVSLCNSTLYKILNLK